MKKETINALILGTGILCLSIAACKKDAVEDQKQNTPNTTYNSLEGLYDANDPDMQTFTIDPTKPTTINGKEGSVITIPANVLVDANNNLVSGPVTVSLKEILNVKDVLFSGVFTESDGKLLASGGEFFFEITDANNEKLNMQGNDPINITVPADKNGVDSTMQMFVGNNEVDSNFTWVVADSVADQKDSIQNEFTVETNTEAGFGEYSIDILNLNCSSWYNIDRFAYCTADEFTLTVNVSGNENERVNYQVFQVYPEVKSVWRFKDDGSTTSSSIDNMWWHYTNEYDSYAYVVGISEVTKKIYFGKVLTTGTSATVNINVLTETQLLEELKNL